MTFALTFPGQGSQHVGMGKELAQAFTSARDVFEEVDEAIGQNLFALMTEGPLETLTLTQNAQPALMAVSLAVVNVLKTQGGIDTSAAQFVAGHSLGEYSALAAASTFSLADTARLLKLRGQAMQTAVPVGEGAMAALLGLDLEAARTVAVDASIAANGAVCTAANDNAPGQVVISGAKAAVEAALEIAQKAGAKRAIMLTVSAPFHCALMRPAAEAMATALAEVSMRPPTVPVVANVSVKPLREPSEIRQALVEQVTAMVRWRETIEFFAANEIETVYELGAGKVLSGLAKRIDRSVKPVSVAGPADVEAMIESLK
ncbi:MAG: ACP S-malonyltransferase [Alphaproteobacteria bacterium]